LSTNPPELSEEAAAMIARIERIIGPLPHCLRVFRSCVSTEQRRLRFLASHDKNERKRANDKRSRVYLLREFSIRGQVGIPEAERQQVDKDVKRLLSILTKDAFSQR